MTNVNQEKNLLSSEFRQPGCNPVPLPKKTAEAFRDMVLEPPTVIHGNMPLPYAFFIVDGKTYALEENVLVLEQHENKRLVWRNPATIQISKILDHERFNSDKYELSSEAIAEIFKTIELRGKSQEMQ